MALKVSFEQFAGKLIATQELATAMDTLLTAKNGDGLIGSMRSAFFAPELRATQIASALTQFAGFVPASDKPGIAYVGADPAKDIYLDGAAVCDFVFNHSRLEPAEQDIVIAAVSQAPNHADIVASGAIKKIQKMTR